MARFSKKKLKNPPIAAGVKITDKGTVRYDWHAMKLEFFKGPWLTAKDYMVEKRLLLPSGKQNVNIVKGMKGWAEEKKEWMDGIVEKATDQLADEQVEDVKKVRARQARLSRWMYLKGAAVLQKADDEDIDLETARKLVVDGLKQEREALGVGNEKKGGGQGTQVNINLPTTRLDEFIEQADYKDILKLLGEVKRRRSFGAGEVIDAEGEGEVQ